MTDDISNDSNHKIRKFLVTILTLSNLKSESKLHLKLIFSGPKKQFTHWPISNLKEVYRIDITVLKH